MPLHEFCNEMAAKATVRAETAAPGERRAWRDVASSWRAMANAVLHEDATFQDAAPEGEVGPIPLKPRRH